MPMTEEQEMFLMLRGAVAELPELARKKTMETYAQIKGIVDQANAEIDGTGHTALALLGSEIAAQ